MSMAGMARSSSGPDSWPVNATRIGWNKALPLIPVTSRALVAAARKDSLVSGPASAMASANAAITFRPSGSAARSRAASA